MSVRFWSKVDKSGGPEACWIWDAARSSKGYGVFTVDGDNVSAHRYAYELAFGPVPAGLLVCHSCDVKLCVQPAHLFAGTAGDNIRDARDKGRLATGSRHGRVTKPERTARGEANGWSKLTEPQVAEIKGRLLSGETHRAVAAAFGIANSTIGGIARGERWRHVRAAQ